MIQTIELSKVTPGGVHRFIIRYKVGREKEVLDELAEMVKSDLPFDWFDAATLSHQLGQNIASELVDDKPKAA